MNGQDHGFIHRSRFRVSLVLFALIFWLGCGRERHAASEHTDARQTASELVLSQSLSNASAPDVAFNSVDRRWLVVWRQEVAGQLGSRVTGRMVSEAGEEIGAPFWISSGESALRPPKVAYDPIKNEWLVAWVSLGDAVELGDTPWFVARGVRGDGTLLGSKVFHVADTNGIDEAPDVAAGTIRVGAHVSSYFLVTWQQTTGTRSAIHAQSLVSGAPSQSELQPLGPSFRLDVADWLPEAHDSRRPRLSETFSTRVETQPFPDPPTTVSVHHVTFEVEQAGRSDVYHALAKPDGALGLSQVTRTAAQEERSPVVAYNPLTRRSLVAFARGEETFAQLLDVAGSALTPVGGEFQIGPGTLPEVAANPLDDTFQVSTVELNTAAQLWRVAGQKSTSRVKVQPRFQSAALAFNPPVGGAVLWTFSHESADGWSVVDGALRLGEGAEPNQLPVADAGPDIEVAAGTAFQLDATGSSDADGDVLRYRWVEESGVASFLEADGASRAQPTLMAPELEDGSSLTLTFLLEVDDHRQVPSFVSTDSVVVTVAAGDGSESPLADAGPDQIVEEGAVVQLDGRSSRDSNGDPVSQFIWTWVNTMPGIEAPSSLSGPTPEFSAPRVSGAAGLDLVYSLRVIDANGLVSEPDEVTIHVDDALNDPPIAHIAPEATGMTVRAQSVNFRLDATGSTDPNGDALTYEWSVLNGLRHQDGNDEWAVFTPPLNAPLVHAALFADRELVIQLTVRDGRGGSDSASITVAVPRPAFVVEGVDSMAGSPGTPIVIRGYGLVSPSTRVYFGAIAPERRGVVRSITPNRIEVLIPAGVPRLRSLFVPRLGPMLMRDYDGVTSGPLIITVDDQIVYQSDEDVEISHLTTQSLHLSQGMDDNALIRDKASLLRVQLERQPQPTNPAMFDGVRCRVTPSGLGARPPSEVSESFDARAALAPGAIITDIDDTANCFWEERVLGGERFGFDVWVTHNGIEVARATSVGTSESFQTTRSPRILVVHALPPDFSEEDFAAHRAELATSIAEFRRMTPWPDTDYVESPERFDISSHLDENGELNLDPFGPFGQAELLSDLEAYRVAFNLSQLFSGRPERTAGFVAAYVPKSIRTEGSPDGFAAYPPQWYLDVAKKSLSTETPLDFVSEAAFLFLEALGAPLCVLTLGGVCTDPIEQIIDAFGAHPASINFSHPMVLSHEIGHNLGFVNPYASNWNDSHSKYEFVHAAPFSAGPVLNVRRDHARLFLASGTRASSLMWSRGGPDYRTFHEPLDYRKLVRHTLTQWVPPELPPLDQTPVLTPPHELVSYRSAGLHISGSIDFEARQVSVLNTTPVVEGIGTSPRPGGSPLTLAFVDAEGELLGEPVAASLSPVGAHVGSEEFDVSAILFSVQADLPEQAAAIELRLAGETIWRRDEGVSAPSVTLSNSPDGRHVRYRERARLTWQASPSDLEYTVFYSSDGGASYVPLAAGLREETFDFSPLVLEGSDQAVVKVRAFDGFTVSEMRSDTFHFEGTPPSIGLLSPRADGAYVASRAITLEARLLAPASPAPLRWSSSVDGELGQGDLVKALLSPGVHRIEVRAEAQQPAASAEVEITVLADADGDGIADQLEAQHPALDPDDASDISRDSDEDGISDAREILNLGSDPFSADSDGDHIADGDELARGLRLTDPDSDGDGVPDGLDNCPDATNPGQEDDNLDGQGDVCDIEREYVLEPGPNWIGIPASSSGITSAFALLRYLEQSSIVLEVARWDAARHRFQRAIWSAQGELSGEDFSITDFDGLRVTVSERLTFAVRGNAVCWTPDLTPGLHLVSLPCLPEGSTAFTFLESDRNFAVKKLEHPAMPTLKAGINKHGRTHGDDFALSPTGAYWALVEKTLPGRPGH